MMRVLGRPLMCLLALHTIVEAAGTYYEDISGNDGNTYIEGSMQRTPVINKSFHMCSISDYCNFVIKNLSNGHFSLHNNTADLPRNTTGIRIWRKIYHEAYKSCQVAYSKGYKATVVIPISVSGMGLITVRCDMVTDGGGWIVFQRRVDASVDFYREWDDYKNGFGDLNGNFWLGLEKIHKLTSTGKAAKLRVDIKHFRAPDTLRYAEYSSFKILSESEGYTLIVNGYSGNAGDSLKIHANHNFTTMDRDHDSSVGNCAKIFKGSWWYAGCHFANLNGLYPKKNQTDPEYMGWKTLYDEFGGAIFSEMKIKYS